MPRVGQCDDRLCSFMKIPLDHEGSQVNNRQECGPVRSFRHEVGT